MENKKYSLIWKEFSAKTPIAERLKSNSNIYLPYFIDGIEIQNFEKGTLNSLQEIHLLRGILLGYNENPPAISNIEISKKYFPIILNDLKEHFGMKSIEDLILNICSFIRRENGDHVSLKCLENGIKLNDLSSKIKFDYCVDLYNILERDEYENRNEGVVKLKEIANKINPNEINQNYLTYLETFKS